MLELSRNVQSENTQNHGYAGIRQRDEPVRLKKAYEKVCEKFDKWVK